MFHKKPCADVQTCACRVLCGVLHFNVVIKPYNVESADLIPFSLKNSVRSLLYIIIIIIIKFKEVGMIGMHNGSVRPLKCTRPQVYSGMHRYAQITIHTANLPKTLHTPIVCSWMRKYYSYISFATQENLNRSHPYCVAYFVYEQRV